MNRRNIESGAALIESAISVGVMILMLFGTIDIINMFRYASAAYSVAITTARYGAVVPPNIATPTDDKLVLPVGARKVPYLVAWRDHEWQMHTGGSGPATPTFTPQVLAALNLGLGLASDIFGTKAKTVSNWKAGSDVFVKPPLPGEFYLVPMHYINANKLTNDLTVPATYRFCFNFSGIILPDTTVCRDASATQYDQV